MDYPSRDQWSFEAMLMVSALVFGALCGLLFLAHYLLTLPMRRAERARLFLDLIETAIKDGKPVEETLISISQSRERAVGIRFYAFAARLEMGTTFEEALAQVPRFLPAPVRAMLAAGKQMGDLGKVLPACRQLLKDAAVATQSATPYLFVLTLFATPFGLLLYKLVIPKFQEIARGSNMTGAASNFIFLHESLWFNAQMAMLSLLILAGFFYVAGPRVGRFFPRWQYLAPWRRNRMRRDFSTLLGVLLDAGAPEPEAVKLAADCADNRVFRRRAARVLARLEEGVALPEALSNIDGSGEFRWRLRNAFHARANFLKALEGWSEALDAKAYQQEQAASTWITTGLTFWNGIFVGALVISIFMVLVSFIEVGVLW